MLSSKHQQGHPQHDRQLYISSTGFVFQMKHTQTNNFQSTANNQKLTSTTTESLQHLLIAGEMHFLTEALFSSLPGLFLFHDTSYTFCLTQWAKSSKPFDFLLLYGY